MHRFSLSWLPYTSFCALAGAVGCGADGPVAPLEQPRCSAVVSAPSGDATETLQTALIEAQSGDTVCLEAGTYSVERELSLTVRGVTLTGMGEAREDVVLDFAAQSGGDDGITVTADGFTIENLSVKNTPGNGIVVTGAKDVTFRNLSVSWDAGSVTENGAYAIYPVKCTGVLVEDTEVVGAADAGIYVGQSNDIIVRRNEVHSNVAGIEIENSSNADVYENHAYDNTAGVLVFVLPNLEKKDGVGTLVRDNLVEANNRENFGETGTVVASVPPGIGVLVLAADDTEIRNNEIKDHDSAGVLAVSYETLAVLLGKQADDPETDLYAERTYVHDNSFDHNGTNPRDALSLIGATPLEDVLWDGIENPDGSGAELCLGEDPTVAFRNFNGVAGLADPNLQETDPNAYACALPSIEL